MINFEINIKQSKKLLILIFILHIVSLVIVMIYFEYYYIWIINFSLLFSIYTNSKFYHKYINRIFFKNINTNNINIDVIIKNNFYNDVKLSKNMYITSSIIIIKLIINNKKYHKVILPDMLCSKEEFIYLLLILRWGNFYKLKRIVNNEKRSRSLFR